MALRNLLKHNVLTDRLLFKYKNNIRIGETNHLYISERRSRKNIIHISGKDNEIAISKDLYFSSNKIDISGQMNHIQIGDNTITGDFYNNSIRICGDNNSIKIDDGTRLTSCNIFILGNSNQIHIKKACSLVITSIHIEQDNNTVMIHNGCTFHGREKGMIELALDEGSSIIIQQDCMISNDVRFRSSDSHSIITLNKKRLNKAADIIIAEHTWICMGAIILKGFSNGKNTVIAAGSLCSKSFPEENVLIGGNPARIIKSNIDWDRKYIDDTEN